MIMIDADLVYPVLLFILATAVLWVYIHQISFFILAIFTAKRIMHRKVERLPETPGVSIVKPLMGVDPFLRENLISHFQLDYPKFEILFCVQDENDSAIDLVNSLRQDYPQVDAQLLIGGRPGIVNPMVDNMAPAYAAAKYDLVWISTSKIKVSTPMIWDMVEKSLDPNVALVHQSTFFADQPGFFGALEKVCFGCSISRNQLALNQLGVVCFVGMSYIIKKHMLDEIGGLEYYGKYLAEDFFISNTLHARGYRLVMSDFPCLQNIATTSFHAYLTRMVRWLRLRLRMLPLVAGFFEPITECITSGLMLAFALSYLFEFTFLHVLLAHFFIWISLDYILLCSVQNSKLPFGFPMFLLAWVVHEILVYVIFFKALLNPSLITWGRYSYRVFMGGLTTRLPLPAQSHRSHKLSGKPNHVGYVLDRPLKSSSPLNGTNNQMMTVRDWNQFVKAWHLRRIRKAKLLNSIHRKRSK
ncbi:unnamed protein product [Calicophoron daubneyi]|uniref:ceramide glucosyltransferase n=1 Tax=Calicophoron daubneyi TaxID=300641 RepID=A0AAV2TJ55_CALDB